MEQTANQGMNTAIINKTYTRVPLPVQRSVFSKAGRALMGTFLAPFYLHLARRRGQPGTDFADESRRLASKILFTKHRPVDLAELYSMVFWPIESTRYFEFDAAWRLLSGLTIRNFLDVSSPRLFPLALAHRHPDTAGELINPDPSDLRITASLLKAAGVDRRCHVSNVLIENAPFAAQSFDLVTSLSVVEHIPDAQAAVRRMWQMLRPGGRLVLSVPCMAQAEQQYIDVDHFGLQTPGADGFYLLQYVYDEALLGERFFSVLGQPSQTIIYGEKRKGSLRQGLLKKWSGDKYPRWREPYTMWQDFQRYHSVAELPGEGVIIMRFDRS